MPTNSIPLSMAAAGSLGDAKLGFKSLAPHVAMLCMGIFMARFSLIGTSLGSTVTDLMFMAAYASLFVALLYMGIAGPGQVSMLGVLVVLAAGLSLVGCEQINRSWPRWVGWSAMVVGFGPVCFTLHACYFRKRMYEVGQKLFLGSVLTSAVWWLAGLPNLGVGDFTGIMWHSIQLGSNAALVGVIAISRMTNGGPTWWYGVYGACALVAMLASSRAALAAMAFGTLIALALKLRRSALISSLVLFSATIIAFAPRASLDLVLTALPSEFTSGLARKRFEHSREQHWEARWEEFYSSQWTGVGFMSAWEDTVGVDSDTGAVETGSSYLAILSMTGIVGAGAMLLLACSMVWGLYRHWHSTAEVHRVEICSMAGFWLVHLGAEGYIFAVGSLMNLIFWLWLGCLNDHFKLCRHKARTRARLSKKPLAPSQQRPATHRAALITGSDL